MYNEIVYSVLLLIFDSVHLVCTFDHNLEPIVLVLILYTAQTGPVPELKGAVAQLSAGSKAPGLHRGLLGEYDYVDIRMGGQAWVKGAGG